MKIVIEDLTNEKIMRRACDMTRKPGKPSKISRDKLFLSEHSPIRTIQYWIELHGIPSFVSTHLVRHKFGVEHFVESNRDDRGGAGDEVVNRLTPVNHGMLVNAMALINISRKRLCYNSHRSTVAVWIRVVKELARVTPAIKPYLVPECIYRGGKCPELKMCKPGLDAVMRAYAK